jgi:hypothetical protein
MKRATMIIAATAIMSASAAADPLTPRNMNDDEWRFSVSTYAFIPLSTTGTSTIAGGEVDLDFDLADALDLLNFAIAGRSEAWKGDFGIILDASYVDLGMGGDIGLPGPGGGTASIDVKIKQGWVTLLGAYRVANGAYDDTGRRYSFDLQAGARYNRLKQKIDASIDIGPAPGIQTDLGGTETWWEPVVGARGTIELSDRWTAALMADIGGFGVGGDDLQWRVLGGVGYRPWENTSLKFGWQFYGIDFSTNRSDGKFAYDGFQTGPYLALTYQFQ